MYGNVPTGMILHPCHVPPVAGKQYTLQDNVPMYALMHCAKSNGYFWDFRQHFPGLTSDVVRCHQTSYKTLFTNRLTLSNFAKSKSVNGEEHASSDHSTPWTSRSNPTKEDSLFKRTEHPKFNASKNEKIWEILRKISTRELYLPEKGSLRCKMKQQHPVFFRSSGRVVPPLAAQAFPDRWVFMNIG